MSKHDPGEKEAPRVKMRTLSPCATRRRKKWLRHWWPSSALVLMIFTLISSIGEIEAIKCYVCGGRTGRPCEDIQEPARRSPYVRPSPIPASDGSRQWEVCNDIINNRGCIKQVVNNVVLLRACWMQATDKCLVDGEATVCTCNEDLCNSARASLRRSSLEVIGLTVAVFITARAAASIFLSGPSLN